MGEQPIFTCKAHVFHIDPKTKRSWIPASSSAINVSFFYDSTRSLYRIISVEGTKAVINSTITPNMAFTKTSQKFGQWSDVRANTVYGLGFPSEAELNKFIDKFQEVKEATKSVSGGGTSTSKHTPAANGSTTPTPAAPAAGPGAGSVSATASPVCSRSAAEKDAAPAELLDADDDGDAVSPALLKSALASHKRSQSLSGLHPGLDSPKQQKADKIYAAAAIGSSATLPAGTHLPSGSLEAQLKYENDRLKLALAQSSANAKKWEVELATLKNNNARLTNALQESTSNVEEWKRQLQAYKEENSRLKAKLLDLESGKTSVDASTELKLELANLREKLELLETENRLKDDEINSLTSNNRDSQVSEDKTKGLEEENSRLEAALETLRNQLEAATDAHDSQRRILETLNNQLWGKIQELTNLHNEMHTALDT